MARINSKQKGKSGELEVVNWLKSLGFDDARRTQQYKGVGVGDVECPESLPNLHIEVKRINFKVTGNQLQTRLISACNQAMRDCPEDRAWCVVWRRDRDKVWRVLYRTKNSGSAFGRRPVTTSSEDREGVIEVLMRLNSGDI